MSKTFTRVFSKVKMAKQLDGHLIRNLRQQVFMHQGKDIVRRELKAIDQ